MSVLSSRPRLEPSHDGTGPVPHYRPPGAPRPEPVEGPPTPHAALRARLEAARAEALAAFRVRPQVAFVARNELEALNADLETIRRLNAPLPHNMRSARVAAWPVPVFRPTALHSWRDLYDALAAAGRVLGAAEAQAQSWFGRHA